MNGFSPSCKERSRTIWTPSMDRFFIDLVLDQVRRGNMDDHAFRKQIWVHMTTLFNGKFGYQYGKDILKNRYKSLRRKYNEITTILNHNGFHWDEARQMIVADDNVWDDYLKGHPEKRFYRTKVLQNYSDLCLIYGNDLSDGTYSAQASGYRQSSCSPVSDWDPVDDAHDLPHLQKAQASGDVQSSCSPVADRDPVEDAHDLSRLQKDVDDKNTGESMTSAHCQIADKRMENSGCAALVPNILSSKEQVESSYLGGEMGMSNHLNEHPIVVPAVNKKPQGGNGGSVMDALWELVTAVKYLKDSKKEKNNSIPIENVMDALKAVPDLDEDLLLDACSLLEDDRKAVTFLALDARLRKKWLMRKLCLKSKAE